MASAVPHRARRVLGRPERGVEAGSEWAREPRRPRLRRVHGALAAAVGAGLLATAFLLVQLRTDSILLRYRLADALATEQELLEQQLALTLEVRRLRDPARLAREAAELGLRRPHRVVTLPATRP